MNPTFNRRIFITAVAAVAIAASAFSTVAMTREPAAASNQPRAYVDASSIQKQVKPAYPRKARLMVYEANCRGSEISYAKSRPTESHLGHGTTVWACQLSL